MNIQSIILLGVLVVAFVIALKYTISRKGCSCGGGSCQKSGCSGNCSGCPYKSN